jgi:hypothetical protein
LPQAPRRIGSHTLGEFPLDVVRIDCDLLMSEKPEAVGAEMWRISLTVRIASRSEPDLLAMLGGRRCRNFNAHTRADAGSNMSPLSGAILA